MTMHSACRTSDVGVEARRALRAGPGDDDDDDDEDETPIGDPPDDDGDYDDDDDDEEPLQALMRADQTPDA
jgi:hypothetical protein